MAGAHKLQVLGWNRRFGGESLCYTGDSSGLYAGSSHRCCGDIGDVLVFSPLRPHSPCGENGSGACRCFVLVGGSRFDRDGVLLGFEKNAFSNGDITGNVKIPLFKMNFIIEIYPYRYFIGKKSWMSSWLSSEV